MSKTAKSKLKWVLYTGEMFDVYVTPNQIKRLHAPLEPDLEYVPEMRCKCLHLRPGAAGLDKDGAIVAYLYCTDSGRFFDHGKDRWGEHKYCYSLCHQNYKGGSVHPFMGQFGDLQCHLIVAHAWIGKRPEGKVCDHLDTNLLNLNATNFEWITVPENIRRSNIARRMRKNNLDPKRLTPTLIRGIFSLPHEIKYIDALIKRYLRICAKDNAQMLPENIRLNIALALDRTVAIVTYISKKSKINDNK